jgi:hypothetical protein
MERLLYRRAVFEICVLMQMHVKSCTYISKGVGDSDDVVGGGGATG